MYRLRFRLLDTLLIEGIKIFKEKNIEQANCDKIK